MVFIGFYYFLIIYCSTNRHSTQPNSPIIVSLVRTFDILVLCVLTRPSISILKSPFLFHASVRDSVGNSPLTVFIFYSFLQKPLYPNTSSFTNCINVNIGILSYIPLLVMQICYSQVPLILYSFNHHHIWQKPLHLPNSSRINHHPVLCSSN